jgi:hypothetical protein
MKAGKTILVVLAVTLLVAGAAAAQSQPAQTARTEAAAKQAADHGVIRSITDTELVIVTRVGDKEVENTYVLNAQTVRKGNLVPGAKVIVRYSIAGTVRTAIKVKVGEGKHKGEAKQPQ